MNSRKAVIITGACGGIGRALVRAYSEAGYCVLATDSQEALPEFSDVKFFRIDLRETVEDLDAREKYLAALRSELVGYQLIALVNNAAEQIIKPIEEVTVEDWNSVLSVNLLAPFFWTQYFLDMLEVSSGSVLNISSIHARQTKKDFSVYATSKAALSGLTRLMSIELGNRIRVNAIEPAAISTQMLEAGFANSPSDRKKLDAYHPTKRIGTTDEVAQVALFITSERCGFLNGASIAVDGGIGNLLHDPAN
jgi:NAD(P)-dependent dehydrogenase (short-subunit alcohol dehydrogenase family)